MAEFDIKCVMWLGKLRERKNARCSYLEEEVKGMSILNLTMLIKAASRMGCRKAVFTSYGTYKVVL